MIYLLPTGAATRRILIHEFRTVALNCPTAVNLCLSSSSSGISLSIPSERFPIPRNFRLRGFPSDSMPPWPRGVTFIGALLLIDGSGLSKLLVRALESAVIPVDGGYVSRWMGPPSPSRNSLLCRISSTGLSASAVRAGAKRLSSWIEFDRWGLLRNFLKGLCIVGSPSWSYHARFLAALLYRSTSKIRKGALSQTGGSYSRMPLSDYRVRCYEMYLLKILEQGFSCISYRCCTIV